MQTINDLCPGVGPPETASTLATQSDPPPAIFSGPVAQSTQSGPPPAVDVLSGPEAVTSPSPGDALAGKHMLLYDDQHALQ